MTEQSVADNTSTSGVSPAKPLLVLTGLILAAAVANVNLAVANVALPTIGTAFDASQTQLNLIAVGYSLGLAASVLYLGAVGDRYGRKLMLLIGTAAAVPLSILAAYAPNSGVLVAARILGGVTGGLCYPTTLALIAALWSGPARTKAIALWSGIGAAFGAGVGPVVAGVLLEHYWWGSVFLLTIPIAGSAFVLCWFLVPGHVNENTKPVDNLGGVLSVVLVGALILALNFAVVPGSSVLALCLAIVAIAGLVAFVMRQRRVANPLYDLHIAARPTFWVAALAGMVVFGSLMGAIFVGQQFLQNVLGYSTVEAGAAALPAAVLLVVVAPFSARLVVEIGSRLTLLIGYGVVFVGFAAMLLLWGEGTPYWEIGLAYALVGIGVGFASTPAAHSLTGSVPTTRVGMASGTADLQRDLGGAVMQSICRSPPHGGLRIRVRRKHRRGARRQPGLRRHRVAADEVLRQRRGDDPAVPEVLPGHHLSSKGRIPGRQQLGLHRRPRRGGVRGRPRLLLLSAQGRRSDPGRRLPRGRQWGRPRRRQLTRSESGSRRARRRFPGSRRPRPSH